MLKTAECPWLTCDCIDRSTKHTEGAACIDCAIKALDELDPDWDLAKKDKFALAMWVNRELSAARRSNSPLHPVLSES